MTAGRLIWIGDQPYADRKMLATLYAVSERTVRRHCTPTHELPRTGTPRGEGGGSVFYNALTAGEALAGITPRVRAHAALTAAAAERRRREGTT